MTLDESANTYKTETMPPAKRRRFKNKIAAKAKPMVAKIVGKINTPKGVEYSKKDLHQEAMFMVFKALKNYDVSKDNLFSTYMYIRVRGRVIQYIRNNDTMTRTQRNRAGKIRDIAESFEQVKGRRPSPREVSELGEIPLKKVRACIRAENSRHSNSINGKNSTKANKSRCNILDKHVTVKPKTFDREDLLQKMESLSVKERATLILYYFYEMTGREIACLLDVSLLWIYRLKKRSLKKIRKAA